MHHPVRHYVRSSSFIMAALFTVLCGMAAISLGYFINYFTTGHFVHSTEAALNSQITLIKETGASKQGAHGDYVYLYLKEDGSLPPEVQSVKRFSEGIEGMLVFTYQNKDKRYAGKIYSLKDNRKILLGFDITAISNDFKFMQILGVFSIVFVMLVVFFSYLISLFVVSGTNKIATTAQDIMHTGDLSRRLEITSRWDDLSNMAIVLNALLARVEELMMGVRQVSDSIAHDLRTPLTRMRNHIEDLQKKYGHDDYAALLDEADHLLSTFTALLRVSRIETEQQRSHFATLDLQQTINDVVEFYEPLAEEKGVSLHVNTASASLYGDKDLIFQAYANLLDNAIKFTPKGGKICVTLEKSKEGTKIIIEDNGPGVAESDLDKIFDRFYRAEKSRTSPGTGLGLSLVRAVIELHDGKISAKPNNPGLKILTIL